MKLKTHRGAKKRVKVTGTGKFMFRKAGKQHLLINKSKRQKKLSPLGSQNDSGDQKKMERLLPWA